MYSPPPVTLLLPRVLLEAPLPVSGPGISSTVSFISTSGPATLQIGLVDRWGRAPTSSFSPPGLTLELFTVLCALLSLRDRGPITYNSLFRLLTPSSGTCSAHHREALKQSLATLASIDCALTVGDGNFKEGNENIFGPTAQQGPTRAPHPAAGGAHPPAPHYTESKSVATCHYAPLINFTPTAARAVFGKPTPAFLPVFHPAFLDSLGDASATALFRFDSLLAIRSRLARSLFCFLPTWAHYGRATAAKPFRITLSKLITHLGSPVPRFASARRAFFYGHRSTGLFDELQNLPTPHGLLNFAITPAASVNDDCLLVWYTGISKGKSFYKMEGNKEEEKGNENIFGPSAQQGLPQAPHPAAGGMCPPAPRYTKRESAPSWNSLSHSDSSRPSSFPTTSRPSHSFSNEVQEVVPPAGGARGAHSPSNSRPSTDPLASFRGLKLYQAWAAAGRPDAEFLSRVRASATLSSHDQELLSSAGVSLATAGRFLTLAKKLLPERTWLDLLGEARYAATAATASPRSPQAKLISEILSAVRAQL